MTTTQEQAIPGFMFHAGDLPFTPIDFLCPVCRERLVPTPSGFYACFDPDHTKLLSKGQARLIAIKLFREEALAQVTAWQARQMTENRPDASDDPGTPGVVRTSIRGVYQIAGDQRLFRVTKKEELAEMKAKRKRSLVMLRTIRPKEFLRLLRRGSFFAAK
ncbi:hypothetical protein [Blastopirellula marina]|uniref:Uncharacterized protein n=1 Tax=Blastopirellula marina TaxID=124 RepID=A0A2S8F7I7_9BACT|nr:hypothetical protein [Blastopirellula marina]PQO28115.1 hypothetical protein C5Y98_24725 [Blastopirellula marina]PTL41655.1 hypothetical protein C5Y97_24740 [Blastopirellula marina]